MASTEASKQGQENEVQTLNFVEVVGEVVGKRSRKTGTDGVITTVTVEQPKDEGEARKPSRSAKFKRSVVARRQGRPSNRGERFMFAAAGPDGEALLEGIEKGQKVTAIGEVYESDPYRALLNLTSIKKAASGAEATNVTRHRGVIVDNNEDGEVLTRIPLTSGGLLNMLVIEIADVCYAVMLRGVDGQKLAENLSLGEEVEVVGRVYSRKSGGKTVLSIEATAITPVVVSGE